MADIPVNASDALVVASVSFNGQVTFNFDFRCDELADLQAIYREGALLPIYLSGGVDFTATGLGTANGGTITLTSFTDTHAGASLTIYRNSIIQRLTDFTRDMFAQDINTEMDHIFMILQELRRQLDSALTVAPGVTPPNLAELMELLERVDDMFPPIMPGQAGYVLAVRGDLSGYDHVPQSGGGGGGGDPYATQAEAEAGAVANRVMSPLRVWDAMRKRSKWETIVDSDLGPGSVFNFLNLGAFDFLNLRLRGQAISGAAGPGRLELSTNNGASWIQTNYLYNFIYQDSVPGMGGLSGVGTYIMVADGFGWSQTKTARCNIELDGFNKNIQTAYESRTWAAPLAGGGTNAMRQAAGIQSVAAVHNAFRLVFAQQVSLEAVS